MNIILDRPIKSIMTENLMTVGKDIIMTEVAAIFNDYNFHHIPVLDEDNRPLGMISKSDFHQLQHHFTHLELPDANEQNQKFFGSLLASEIMVDDLVCLTVDDSISDAVDIFLKNKIHSILICKDDECVGIVTPYDIIKSLVEPALMSKQ
ncbi:MAG: CBS domain-containing protein [Saprospiraceae bacterium]|nr:CBS domain-containing protein [Saprospiraceae bacterium]